MRVDILLGVGNKGGVENVINSIVDSEIFHDDEIRVVQMFYEGNNWLHKKSHFYPLMSGKDGHTLEEMTNAYLNFVVKNGSADIALCTWPYLCYSALCVRKILTENDYFIKNNEFLVASYLHSEPIHYKEAGFGDEAYLAMADCHFAISDRIKDALNQISDGKSVVRIYNPAGNLKKNVFNHSKSGILAYVGRISYIKRLDIILNALLLTKTKELKLLIAGTAAKSEKLYAAGLEQFVKDNNLSSRVTFLGWQSDPFKKVAGADFLIMPSDYEGASLSFIECLLAGIPVISTPCGIAPEVIVPGENGYIVPFNDPVNLANVLDAIYTDILPIPNPSNCQSSVKNYVTDTALLDMRMKLSQMLKNIKIK